MNKTNKILMRAVAILLCLVLISISVVSSVFARYVIAKDTSTTIKLNKFGVSLGLTLSDEFVEYLGGEEVVADMMTVNGDSISINIPNLKMAPGESYLDAISFNISGTPNVRAKVVIEPKVVFEEDDFAELNDGTFWGVPVGLYYSAYDKNFEKVIKPFVPTWDGGSFSKYQLSFGCDFGLGIDYGLTACTNDPAAGWSAKYGWTEKIFDKDQNVVFYSSNDSNKTHAINQFDFHLMWEEGQQDRQNELDTAIGNANPKPALSIILNVKIEQVNSTYESPVPVESED